MRHTRRVVRRQTASRKRQFLLEAEKNEERKKKAQEEADQEGQDEHPLTQFIVDIHDAQKALLP